MRPSHYRRHLADAGEPMLMPVHAVELCLRAAAFIADSRSDDAPGLAPEDVFIEPLLGIPLPVAIAGDDGDLLPWTDVDPDLLWHPLFWLPKRLALPARFELDDGTVEIETRTEWALRVMLEVHSVGLWDHERGWADVWAIAGVDATAPDHHERVLAWQGGGTDDVLDAITLDDLVGSDENAAWAYRRARLLAELLQPVSLGRHARLLAAAIDDAIADPADNDAEALVLSGAALVALGDDSEDTATRLTSLFVDATESAADPASTLHDLRLVCAELADRYRDAADAADELLTAA